MRDTVICEPLRAPVGRFGRHLKRSSAAELGTIARTGLRERTGIEHAAMLGHCYPTDDAALDTNSMDETRALLVRLAKKEVS